MSIRSRHWIFTAALIPSVWLPAVAANVSMNFDEAGLVVDAGVGTFYKSQGIEFVNAGGTDRSFVHKVGSGEALDRPGYSVPNVLQGNPDCAAGSICNTPAEIEFVVVDPNEFITRVVFDVAFNGIFDVLAFGATGADVGPAAFPSTCTIGVCNWLPQSFDFSAAARVRRIVFSGPDWAADNLVVALESDSGVATIPEAGSLALVALGLLAAMTVRKRRERSS